MGSLFGPYPFLLKLYADGGYHGVNVQAGLRTTCRPNNLAIVKRAELRKFVVLPKRWIVERTIAWLNVSKAGDYAWAHRATSAHAMSDAALLKRVRTSHAGSRQTYGSARVHADLRACGEKHERKRIVRLMRMPGWPAPAIGMAARRPHQARPGCQARAGPGGSQLHSVRARSFVGRRHHLRANCDGLPLLGCRAGRVDPQDRRVDHGKPSAC
jgi:transposase